MSCYKSSSLLLEYYENKVRTNQPFEFYPTLSAATMESIPRQALSHFLQRIRKTLEDNEHADSFGSLFNVGISQNTRVICCAFASKTPKEFKAPKYLTWEGTTISVLVIGDSIQDAGAGLCPLGARDIGKAWREQPINTDGKLRNSVGVQDDM